jgi:hypothetical protein
MMSRRISKVAVLPFLAVMAMTAVTDSAEAETIILDYSSVPINSNSNGFGINAGVQFLNSSTFLLDSVTILLGLDSPGTSTFQVIEFDGGLGDMTGTVIGSIAGVSVGGLTFDNFPADAFTVDLSGLELTLQQNVVYGFVLVGGSSGSFLGNIRGGSSQSVDSDATIGVIFNGDGIGNFSQSWANYEIPFVATAAAADLEPTADAGVDQSVAVGQTVALNGASSSDDNTPTADLDFAWSFVSKPDGSEASIANPALGSTSFVTDMPGDYVVQLVVTDNLGQDSAADEMQVAAEIDPAFVFERLTTGGYEGVTTYDYDDGSYESTSTQDYHYDPFLRNGNVAARRFEYDYSYNTATGVYDYDYRTSIDLLQSEDAPLGTLVKTGETPIPGTTNAVFSSLYPRGFVDSELVFQGYGCGEEDGVRRCTGGEYKRDLTANAVVESRSVETPVPVDGAADPLTRVWGQSSGYYYWYGRYGTNELWAGSDGRIVRSETYTYEYNSTIRTYTRNITHRGIYTIDGGLATTVVDNEMQVPLAAPGTQFYYFGSAVIDAASGVTAFVGMWYDATDARYRQGLFEADTLGTITRILDDNDNQWFRGWYSNLQFSGGNLYWSGYRYEGGNLNGAWWSSYEQGIYRSAGSGVEPVVTGKRQYFSDYANRDCGYVSAYINTYNWYALPDGAVFNRSNYAYDCAIGESSSTNEGIVWRENGVDYPVVQTYNTEILGTTYSSVYLPWVFGQSVDGRTLAFNAQAYSPYSCAYDTTENSRTCEYSGTVDTLLARFDSDRDGEGDDVDNCPLYPNPDQTDSDVNGIGDPCEDSDDDTVPDGLDNCPLNPNLDQVNRDADSYGDACDVCPIVTDDQSDIDGDGLGDACDPNSDADTINDEFDNCPFIANEDQANNDGDLLGDLCDPDVDGDGIANAIDGQWDGATFTDQSEQSSRNFSDHDLGGISYGRVQQAANGTLIEDSPDPTRGVEINTINSSGQTSIKQCDFVGREARLVVPQGTIEVLDCGSINLESLMNGGFLVLDGDIVIDVPTATAASVTDLGDGDFAVANTSETSLPIEMNLGSDVSVTVPSGSTGQVSEPEEGQYEIQNSPDSVEPIVAEVNGVTYVYEPGDIGVPVEVDVLPESAENFVYIGRRGGVADVAILSSAVFDALQVDPATISLSGASVKASRKNKAVADEKDVNGDGLIDLLFKVEAQDIELEDNETAVLTAMTYGGVAVFGSDAINVVVTGGR